MELPFDTHDIYISFDRFDEEGGYADYYKLNNDFTKRSVNKIPVPTMDKPTLVFHQGEFNGAFRFLTNKQNPFKMDKEVANIFYKIGFITKEELENFKDSEYDNSY